MSPPPPAGSSTSYPPAQPSPPSAGGHEDRDPKSELQSYIHPWLPTWLGRNLVGAFVLAVGGLLLKHYVEQEVNRRFEEKEHHAAVRETREVVRETREAVRELDKKVDRQDAAGKAAAAAAKEEKDKPTEQMGIRLDKMDKRLDALEKRQGWLESLVNQLRGLFFKEREKVASDARKEAVEEPKDKAAGQCEEKDVGASPGGKEKKGGKVDYMKPPSKKMDHTDPGTFPNRAPSLPPADLP